MNVLEKERKNLAQLEKQRDALLQQQREEESAETALAEAEAKLEEQRQVLFDAGHAAAFQQLGRLRKRETALVGDFVKTIAQLEQVQEQASALRLEVTTTCSPFKLGVGDERMMNGLEALSYRFRVDAEQYEKGYKQYAKSMGYGR